MDSVPRSFRPRSRPSGRTSTCLFFRWNDKAIQERKVYHSIRYGRDTHVASLIITLNYDLRMRY